jgi:diaminopimelate decarboxylase
MPMSESFRKRLTPILPQIVEHFGTPFHIYDAAGIYETGDQLKQAFAQAAGFREYFAVKALPNPHILAIIRDMGFGFDCSSIPELALSRSVGAVAYDIMFTSNNTSREEFIAALSDGGSILNLDDITLLSKLPFVPDILSFRYNPGSRRTGNAIIGNPIEAKYGISHAQFLDAYRLAREMGIQCFGLHTMIISNELNYKSMVETTRMLLELVEWAAAELGIRFEFINIGGGLGIPYRPDDTPLDSIAMGIEVSALLHQFEQHHGYAPKLYMESGRYITGPHGVLVVRVINQKDTYRRYIGVDASMSALMRPGMYGAYHYVEVAQAKPDTNYSVVDVVGALCENNDKFAVQRPLPSIAEGDLLIIHDTGAHGHAMGFNYNGRLRPQELLLRQDGSVELIRRQETLNDYLATLTFEPDLFAPMRKTLPEGT